MKPRVCFILTRIIRSSTGVTSTTDGCSLLEMPIDVPVHAGPPWPAPGKTGECAQQSAGKPTMQELPVPLIRPDKTAQTILACPTRVAHVNRHVETDTVKSRLLFEVTEQAVLHLRRQQDEDEEETFFKALRSPGPTATEGTNSTRPSNKMGKELKS
ncbi:hypothetical protein GWK47_004773 [Chionoecetes opilio]|uniref:Uncharacterized protein n=1 Tax=Chionoecetes opilio TaxID=41210 RepID=A0A8J4YBV1_CHIOP|nr:hypothetical protein GWK47_004773 [Chionoecetes opilio]